MSAWRVGIEAARSDDPGPPAIAGAPGDDASPIQKAIDTLTKWIPGEVVALYVAVVAAATTSADHLPSVLMLVIFIAITPLWSILAGFADTGEIKSKVILPAILAGVAFTIWSLTVPGSGWERWHVIADNQQSVTIIAAIAASLFGLFASGITKWAAKQ
jgi:hypothetical protein